MSLQTIFILGLEPAQVDRPRAWTYDKYEPRAYGYAHSMALICPRCLTQWAILAFAGDEDIHPQGAFCERHGGGTIFWAYHFDPPLLATLPEALVRRELLLTLDQIERSQL